MANLRFRIVGGMHSAVYRLTGGKVGGKLGKVPVLLLTTIGRKSCQSRTQSLSYTWAGDGYAVIASKGGAPEHPLWYPSLQANPSLAEVTAGPETGKVRARDADGKERERLWRARRPVPGYDKYAQKTTRQIPVVVLEPVADSPRPTVALQTTSAARSPLRSVG